MLKKSLSLALATIISSSAYANHRVLSYKEAEEAILTGKKILFVVDWEKCKSNYQDMAVNFKSNWSPEGIVIHQGDYFGARGEFYSHRLRGKPELGSMFQSFEYIVYNDERLEVVNWFLDPLTRTEKLPAAELECKLNESFYIYVHH